MTTNATHPARSPEFLSRLHDGELTPAERAHFESHRAHCAECRRAAAEFEAALSLYRSSSPSPASPDLAARILRKLQAANRRRDPLGVVFGIDLKWAGAFAAALVATIIGSSIVLRQQQKSPETPPARPTPVGFESSTRETALQKSAGGRALPAPAPPRAETKTRANEKQAAEPRYAPQPAPAEEAEEPPEDVESLVAEQAAAAPPKPAAADKREALARARPRAPERVGGEGGLPSSAVLQSSDVVAAPVRVRIVVLDGHGLAPDRLGPDPELPQEERGREYVLVVDSRGIVFDVRPYARGGRRDEADAVEPAVPEALKRLRFEPGDRPRRLLLRIE